MFFKFLKFGAVGFSGVFLDFFFTYLFKEKFRVNKYVSNSMAFCIAASSNYVFNRLWTFHSQNAQVAVEFSTFMFISFIGMLINNSLLYLFDHKLRLGIRVFELANLKNDKIPPFYIAKVFAIGLTTVWNFFANYFITFGG